MVLIKLGGTPGFAAADIIGYGDCMSFIRFKEALAHVLHRIYSHLVMQGTDQVCPSFYFLQ
jgi:hypothetical protein